MKCQLYADVPLVCLQITSNAECIGLIITVDVADMASFRG
jgi:hypothetical protein